MVEQLTRLYRCIGVVHDVLPRFNTTLHDEVNLDELRAALTDVVYDTMQPAGLALWVRNTHSETVVTR
jgi:hypothetical protein